MASHLLISYSNTPPQRSGDAVSSLNSDRLRTKKRRQDGGYSVSGDGLRAEFDRDSGDNCGDGDGPVGDGGSLQQRRDGRVHVLGPVEVVCPAELRPIRVPTIFHHSGTSRYVFILLLSLH